MSKKKTDSNHIFYYSQTLEEILDMQLDLNMQEIGFVMVFKAGYIYHKGKIPTNKLCQFCRVFEKQEIFVNFIEKNYEKKGNFYYSKSFQKEVNLIIKNSKSARDSVLKRWNNEDTNVDTNVERSLYKASNTNNNVNVNNKHSVKNVIKEKESSVKIPDWVNSENWNEYMRIRKANKKLSTSDRAITILVNSMIRYEKAGYSIEQINESLESTMLAGYPRIYEPKATKQAKTSGTDELLNDFINET